MGKIFALDVGEKRIGIASSDELAIIATPYGYIDRAKSIDTLFEIFSKENAEKVIIGMPYLPSGAKGSQAEDVERFMAELKERISLPILTENEVLTSKEAENRLREMGKKVKDKGEIDMMAATIILEQYLRKG